MRTTQIIFVLAIFFVFQTASAQGEPKGPPPPPGDVNVINTPDVNVANVPDVVVANETSSPIPVSSVVRRIPVLCVVETFLAAGSRDALGCVTPNGMAVSPVPAGFFLAITDVVATSQAAAGSLGQSIVRVTSRIGGTTFGAGVPMILKPGETQSLHYQTPYSVFPANRIPVASVAVNFGDVFPVEVKFTGYLVAVDELGY